MLNVFPGELSHQLTTSHEIFYDKKNYKKTWFPLFYVGYFHHQKYVAATKFSTHYQTLMGIEFYKGGTPTQWRSTTPSYAESTQSYNMPSSQSSISTPTLASPKKEAYSLVHIYPTCTRFHNSYHLSQRYSISHQTKIHYKSPSILYPQFKQMIKHHKRILPTPYDFKMGTL